MKKLLRSLQRTFSSWRRKYQWIEHLVQAKDAYVAHSGSHYAAAMTYFSVLALFPVLMIGFFIVGIILANNARLLNDFKHEVISAAPSGLGELLDSIITAAVQSRAGVGILGLVLALYSGVGWMTNMRDALTIQWGFEKKNVPLVSGFLKDIAALLGLGAALAASFALTILGGGAGKFLFSWVSSDYHTVAAALLRILSIILAIAANIIVFLWVIGRLPREKVSLRSAVRGAIVAAIGFELLKQLGAIYLGMIAHSSTGVLFGPIVGLLIFANMVSRLVLLATAWSATVQTFSDSEIAGRKTPPD